MSERSDLYDHLVALLPAQFEELVFRLGVPPAYLSGTPASLSRRAIELLRYVEHQGLTRRLETLLDESAGRDSKGSALGAVRLLTKENRNDARSFVPSIETEAPDRLGARAFRTDRSEAEVAERQGRASKSDVPKRTIDLSWDNGEVQSLLVDARQALQRGALRDAQARGREAVEQLARFGDVSQGEEHTRLTAVANATLGVVLARLGRAQEAVGCLETALATAQSLPNESPLLSLICRGDLALAQSQRGAAELACSLVATALEQAERTPVTVPLRAALLSALAKVMLASGEPHAALEPATRALEVYAVEYGAEDATVAVLSANLAAVWLALEEEAPARALLDRSIGLLEQLALGDSLLIAHPLSLLGALEAAVGDATRAQILLERAIGRYAQRLGADHLVIALCTCGLAVALERLGHRSLAAARAEEACRIYAQHSDARDPDRASALALRDRLAQQVPSPAPETVAPCPAPIASLTLSEVDRDRLLEALCAAFPTRATLDRLVRFALDAPLDDIAVGSSLAAQVSGLIRWAEQQGRLRALIEGAQLANPSHPQLRTFDLAK